MVRDSVDLPGLLAASGIVGIAGALAVASLFLLVQPIWAIIDCVDSPRDKDAKLLVSLALFLTWGLGSTLYGLFFAASRNLHRFTLFTLALSLLLGIGGMSACTFGLVRSAEQARVDSQEKRLEAERALESFRPPRVAADAVAPFPALQIVHRENSESSAAVAQFTLAGPLTESARDVSNRIRHVAPAGEGLYAITDHDFGAVSPTSGRLVKIAVDPAFEADFSWPKGLAFDSASERLVVMTAHVRTRFYRYDPRRSAWEQLPSEHAGLPLVALSYSAADDSLYALERERSASALTTLHRFNAEGASLGELRLDPPIPVHPEQQTGFQLHASSTRLVLMVPARTDLPAQASRLFLVDPASGAVSAAAADSAHPAAAPRS